MTLAETVQHDKPSGPKHRWFQYNLRTLLIVMALVAIVLGWWSYKVHKQRQVVAAVQRIGGYCSYEKELPPKPQSIGLSQWPALLKHALGQDWFANVTHIVMPEGATNADLQHAAGLPCLEMLFLNESAVDNTGLKQIEHMTGLKQLDLADTQIDDDGLAHIRRLTRLQALSLYNTSVTDAGLTHLLDMTNLEDLDLTGSRVTEAGVSRIKRTLPNCRVNYENVEALPVVLEGIVTGKDCNKYCWYTVTPLKVLKNSLSANVTPSFQAARLSTWSQVRDGGTYLLYLDYYNPANPQWGMRIEHFKKIYAK